jgi:hypothetical protein
MPQLIPILREPKLEFVLEELKMSGTSFQLEPFFKGEPFPLRKILGFQKESILDSIRAELPLWHSMKFIVNIIRFIKHGMNSELIYAKKKNRMPAAKHNDSAVHNIDVLAKSLIPKGQSIDGELDALAEKWNQILDKSARERLRKTVNDIISSNLAFVRKTLKHGSLTISVMEDIAGSLIASNDILAKIHDKKALQGYVTLYMLKLMKTR